MSEADRACKVVPTVIAGCGSTDILKVIHALNSTPDGPNYEILGCLDVDPTVIENGWREFKVWDERAVTAADFPSCTVVNNTGGIPMRRRRKVTESLREKGFTRFDTLVHPNVDQYGVTFGEGCQALGGTDLGPFVTVGNFSTLLLGSNVNHDCKLGEYVFVGPNATVLGRVTLEDGVYVGAGAVIFPEVTIGAWSVVGAGSVVRKDVPPGVVVNGNPAKVIRNSGESGS